MRKRIVFIIVIAISSFWFSCKNEPIILACRISQLHDSIYGNWDTASVSYDNLGRIIHYWDAEIQYHADYFMIYPFGTDDNTWFRYHTDGSGRITSTAFYSCCGPGGENSFDSLSFKYDDREIVHAKEFISESSTEPDFNVYYYYDEKNLAVDSQFKYSTGELSSVTERTYYDEISDINKFSDYQFLQSNLYYYYPFRPDHLIRSLHKTYFEDTVTSEGEWNYSYAFDEQLVSKYLIQQVTFIPGNDLEDDWLFTYDWTCD